MALITVAGLPCSGKSTRVIQLKAYLESRMSAQSYDGPLRKILVLSDDTLGIDRSVYDDSRSEKAARATLFSTTQRNLAADTVLVLDSMNYIKGFRYQLYCAAREAKLRCCTLYVAASQEQCYPWNEQRLQNQSYSSETLKNLVLRFEEPSSMVRWDSPLFTVMWSDEYVPYENIWNAITEGNVKLPSTGTVAVAKAPTNALHILENTTTGLINAIIASQTSAGASGGAMSLPLSTSQNTLITLPERNVTLAELQRVKRQFIMLHKKVITLGNTEKGDMDWNEERIAEKFARYLEEHLYTSNMPLPSNCALSLLGHSRPGDTVHSKPKQAIIIRLSTEILDALEANPDAIKIDFNDSPVLWAGSAHFAMNPAKETLHHELYLRAASATKKHAPLKLHAHVIGKFQVERQLDNDVRSRLRQSAKTLQEQRQERGIIQLETPPIPSSKSAKKKAAIKVSRPVIDYTASGSRESIPLSNRSRNEISKSVRRKMIQLLAVSERTADEIVRLLGGLENTSSERSDLIDLLEQMAEPSTSGSDAGVKSPRLYRLKLRSWQEVRPIEWDWSNEQERSAVSTKFEAALRRLNVSEADSVWDFAVQRNGRDISSAGSVRSRSSIAHAAPGISKTGGALLSTKDKRPKVMRVDSDDHVGKDDRRHELKLTNAQAKTKAQVREATPSLSTPKASTPFRKPPGSGFKSGKASPHITNSNTMTDSRDMADTGTKLGQSSSSLRRQAVTGQANQVHLMKKSDAERGSHRSTVKNEQEFTDKGGNRRVAIPVDGNAQKRGMSGRDSDVGLDDIMSPEPVSKKRKIDRDAVAMDLSKAGPRAVKPQDHSGSKKVSKPIASTRHRSKDEPKVNVGSLPSFGAASSSRNANSKVGTSYRRRRSPIYTSSEDEHEPPHLREDFAHTLPSDHASLRRRYNNSYGEYLAAFHKLVTLRDKIDGILRNNDDKNEGSASDFDADMELMDPDEFGRLCLHHKKLREELESIQLLFSQAGGRELYAST
ncbi:hypothetical protein APHAL10511_000057 [Amanita phalloides]|nr:hypothetical protein APHAL10511_000057 [Amanita phalloides]